jgi:hypothetical protein
MAWVRYDDQFYANPKVTAVVAEDAASLALHVLANTWTNAQKVPGFVPAHQCGVLVCDRTLGKTWAEVLVRHGLWHDVADMCEACQEEYAALPAGVAGYVFHNAKQYRAPARERQTPGTAAELSEKRREAGRRGGRASAAKRNRTKASTSKQSEAKRASEANGGASRPSEGEGAAADVTATNAQQDQLFPPAETQQSAQANQANRVSKTSKSSSNRVTPEPEPEGFASNEANIPPTAGTAPPSPPAGRALNAGDVVAAYMQGAKAAGRRAPTEALRGRVGKSATSLIKQKIPAQDLLAAAFNCGFKGWSDLDVQLQRDEDPAKSRDSSKSSTSNGSGPDVPKGHIYSDNPKDYR